MDHATYRNLVEQTKVAMLEKAAEDDPYRIRKRDVLVDNISAIGPSMAGGFQGGLVGLGLGAGLGALGGLALRRKIGYNAMRDIGASAKDAITAARHGVAGGALIGGGTGLVAGDLVGSLYGAEAGRRDALRRRIIDQIREEQGE